MEFEWDERKNQLNIMRHGVSFEKAKDIFYSETVTSIDERFDYGELREISLGLVEGVLLLTVVHTDRENGKIRLISARKANKRERGVYEKAVR